MSLRSASRAGRVVLSLALAAGLFAAVAFGFYSGKTLSILSFIAIFALTGYSVAIPYRYAGILMVAQGAIWGLGAYTAAVLIGQYRWSLWLVLPIVVVVGAASGLIVGGLSLRSRGHYFLIVSFAINELFIVILNHLDFVGGTTGVLLLSRPTPLGPFVFDTSLSRMWLYVAVLLAGMAVFQIIGMSRFGRRLVAIRENEDLARAIGVNAVAGRLQALALGGAMAGAAGVLYAYQQRALDPGLFSAVTFLQVILMMIIGGSRTSLGPLAGAFLMVYLPNLLNFSPLTSQLSYGVILILVILLLPEGIGGGLLNLAAGRRSGLQALLGRRAAASRGSG